VLIMSVKDPYRMRKKSKELENGAYDRNKTDPEGLRDVLPSTELREIKIKKRRQKID
jgi:hypothetical protein